MQHSAELCGSSQFIPMVLCMPQTPPTMSCTGSAMQSPAPSSTTIAVDCLSICVCEWSHQCDSNHHHCERQSNSAAIFIRVWPGKVASVSDLAESHIHEMGGLPSPQPIHKWQWSQHKRKRTGVVDLNNNLIISMFKDL